MHMPDPNVDVELEVDPYDGGLVMKGTGQPPPVERPPVVVMTVERPVGRPRTRPKQEVLFSVKPEKKIKTWLITVRLNDPEHEEILKRAKERGVKLSTYLRIMALRDEQA